jgi:hypothetical protein
MPRHARTALALIGALAASLLVAPSPAQAAPPVRIYRVQYDSPGSDTGSNASLNAEWVAIKNFGGSRVTITGWRLRDNAGHTYTFPAGTIAPGQIFYIHTGRGTQSYFHRYQNRSAYVWNNTGDTAYLRSPSNVYIHHCRWTSIGSGAVWC